MIERPTRQIDLPPVAYIHHKRTFFVAKDIDHLRQERTVLEHGFDAGQGPLQLFAALRRQFRFLRQARQVGVREVLVHFAGYHSLLPSLFGMRTGIIVAGSDACSFPAMDYGSFRKTWISTAMAWSMRRAHCILPVHASLERFTNTYSDLGPEEQGYGHFVKDLCTPSVAVPYGFDAARWTLAEGARDPKALLCVAAGARFEAPVHFRKGVDLILAAATALPDHHFTVVGVDVPSYPSPPPNVVLRGVIAPEELNQLLALHGTYLQPSVMEGFPNALCEAMLTGCIPVVSNMTAMPGIVDGIGEVVMHRHADQLVQAIQRVTNMAPTEAHQRRQEARARILPLTMARRTSALMQALRDRP